MRKSNSVVGLDLEAGSIAATEIEVNGAVSVVRTGFAPLDPGVFREGEVADTDALGDALREMFGREKLSRTVRLGIANQRVAVRTLRLPLIERPDELETAVRFQAQDHIPMPLEQAVLDWRVVSRSPGEGAEGDRSYGEAGRGEPRMEVVAVAARRDMIAAVMNSLRRAGLRPAGIDLSAFGMIRALAREPRAPVGAGEFVTAPSAGPSYEQRIAEHAQGAVGAPAASPADPTSVARLYCNFGDVTNLAVARGSTCMFTRVSAFGVEGIAQRLAERRGLTLEHARQWLTHVGLERPIEAVDGDRETVAATRDCLIDGAVKLVDELRLSLEFYAAQDGAMAVEGVVACGPGTLIPGLVERLQRDLGERFEIGKPRALSHLDEGLAARLTLAYGLALEE